MSKKKNIIIVILMAIVIYGLSIAGFVLKDKDFSESERRTLTKFPKFTWETADSGEFMEKFEKYTLDQFPLREQFRSLKAGFSMYILGQKDNNDYYIKNGYVSKLEYPLNESSIEYAATCIDSIYNKVLADTDCKIYGVIVPDKNYYMSDGYPSLDYEKMYDIVESRLPYISFVDVKPLLSIEDYYKTDTHWRQEKITDVADTLLDKMGAEKPVRNYTEQTNTKPFAGVYYGQIGLKVPTEELHYLTNSVLDSCTLFDMENNKTLGIYDLEKGQGSDPYDLFVSGAKKPVMVITNPNATTDKELVIFRDSFGSSIAPLLAESYAKITLVDTRCIQPGYLATFLKLENQDVLFLYSTMVLNNSVELLK
ncbi:MAG: DHHW family protein [Lachnospiraceae bacterium]|nr:DHHW family protein [Lachnospiraceae bacterium]